METPENTVSSWEIIHLHPDLVGKCCERTDILLKSRRVVDGAAETRRLQKTHRYV